MRAPACRRLVALSFALLFTGSRAELECGLQNPFVNASDQITFIDPFRTPDGLFQDGSGEWTWTLATQSGPLSGNDTEVSQVLRLNVDPLPDLLGEDPGSDFVEGIQYSGCGVIVHGLRHDDRVRGQNDTSRTCLGSIRQECRERLRFLVEEKARREVFLGVNAESKCTALENLNNGNDIDECRDDFVDEWWLESFAFANRDLNDTYCRFQPGASNSTHAIHTWGDATYGMDNLRSYQNLTTLIEPIITVFYRTLPDSYEEQWARAHIMCLRTGEDVRQGSVLPTTEVPGNALHHVTPTALLSALVALSSLALLI